MKLHNTHLPETELNELFTRLTILHREERNRETPAGIKREIRCLFATLLKRVKEIEGVMK